jgi:hypothetical protein
MATSQNPLFSDAEGTPSPLGFALERVRLGGRYNMCTEYDMAHRLARSQVVAAGFPSPSHVDFSDFAAAYDNAFYLACLGRVMAKDHHVQIDAMVKMVDDARERSQEVQAKSLPELFQDIKIAHAKLKASRTAQRLKQRKASLHPMRLRGAVTK